MFSSHCDFGGVAFIATFLKATLFGERCQSQLTDFLGKVFTAMCFGFIARERCRSFMTKADVEPKAPA